MSSSSDDGPPPSMTVAKDPREELQEVLDYLKFSYRPDATYKGTCVFDITPSETNPHMVFYIRCDPNAPTEAGMGLPSDGKYSCYTTMSRDDFFLLYSGKASPAQVASMCLSGRMKVKWWRYHELQQFATAFTYSTPNWIMFYRLKGKDTLMQKLTDMQWKTALKQNCLVNTNGFIVKPDTLDPEERKELEKVRDTYLHPSPVTVPEPSVPSVEETKKEEPVLAIASMAPVPLEPQSNEEVSKITAIETETQPVEPEVASEITIEPSVETTPTEPTKETVSQEIEPSTVVAVPEENVPQPLTPSDEEMPLTEDIEAPVVTPETISSTGSLPEVTTGSTEDSGLPQQSNQELVTEIILPESASSFEGITTVPESAVVPSEVSSISSPSSAPTPSESTVSARILVPDITSESVVEAAAAASFSSSNDNANSSSTNTYPSSTEPSTLPDAVIPIDNSTVPSIASSSVATDFQRSNRSIEPTIDPGEDIQVLLRLSELLQQTNISSSILHDSNISVLEYTSESGISSSPTSSFSSLSSYITPIDQSLTTLLDTVETNLVASIECEANLQVLTQKYHQQIDNQKAKLTKPSLFSFNFFVDDTKTSSPSSTKHTNHDSSTFSSKILNWFSSSDTTNSKPSPAIPTEALDTVIKRKQKEQIQYDSSCSTALQQIANEIENFEQSHLNGQYLSLLVPRSRPLANRLQADYLFPLMYVNHALVDNDGSIPISYMNHYPSECINCYPDGSSNDKWPILSSLQSLNRFASLDDNNEVSNFFLRTLNIPNTSFRFHNLDSFILHQQTRKLSSHRYHHHPYSSSSLLSSSSQIYQRLRKLLDTMNKSSNSGTGNDTSSASVSKPSKTISDSTERERSNSLLSTLTSSSFSILNSTHAEGMGTAHPHPYHPPNLSSSGNISSIHDIDDIRAHSIHGSTMQPQRSISQGRILPDGAELTIETNDHPSHHHIVPMDGSVPFANSTNASHLPLFSSSAQFAALQFKQRFGAYHASIWDSVLDLANTKRYSGSSSNGTDTYHYGLDTFRDGLAKLPLFLPSTFVRNDTKTNTEGNAFGSIDTSSFAYRTLRPWFQPSSSSDAPTVLTNLSHIETFLFCFGLPFCPLSTRAPVTLGALEVKIDNPSSVVPLLSPAVDPSNEDSGNTGTTNGSNDSSSNTNVGSRLHVALLPIWRPKRLLYQPLHALSTPTPSSATSRSSSTTLPTVYNGLGSHVYLGVAKQRLRLQFQEAMQRVADELPSSSSSSDTLIRPRTDRTDETTALYGFGDETLQSVGPPLSSLMRKDIPSTVVTDIVRTLRKQGVWKLYGRAKALDAFTADSHTIDIDKSNTSSSSSSNESFPRP